FSSFSVFLFFFFTSSSSTFFYTFPYTTLFRSCLSNLFASLALPNLDSPLRFARSESSNCSISLRNLGPPLRFASLRPSILKFYISEDHTSELQSLAHHLCRLLLLNNNIPQLLY